MKNTALRREIVLLTLSGLVIALLLVYVIPSLIVGDQSSLKASRLNDLLKGYITEASDNWNKKKAGEAVDLEKDIFTALISAKNTLDNLYEGKPVTSDLKFGSPSSEDRKANIKHAIVAIDKLKEQIAANDENATSQLTSTNATIRQVINDYNSEASSKWNTLKTLAWVTLILATLFIAGLIVLAYRKLDTHHTQLTLAESKVTEESLRVEQLSGFIEAMASGNYDMQIEAKDELSNTLISMRDKLKNNFVEEQQRNWSTSGLAKIGEILRSSGNSTELYDSIIKFVVKYTNSNQGGIFILNDSDTENPFLNLVACYAFERKKFLTRRVEIGDGLVGQCFMEQDRIHLTEVPADYIRITSGLGGESPTSCLLVPLKVNDKIFGVLELASFKLYPEHVVELVEKFAESIASTISNVKINESTRILLEQTQQQAEEMKSQEEEMRQNMEELSATQEEMHRKEQEYINRIKHLEAEQRMAEKV